VPVESHPIPAHPEGDGHEGGEDDHGFEARARDGGGGGIRDREPDHADRDDAVEPTPPWARNRGTIAPRDVRRLTHTYFPAHPVTTRIQRVTKKRPGGVKKL